MHVKSSNPCKPPSQIFLKFLPVIDPNMSVQNKNFQSDTACTFGFIARQRWPCRPIPGWQKLNFHLAAFC